jgi:hypothetical protein
MNVSPNIPYSFSEYNNELYAASINGIVLVLVNKLIIRSFTACSTHVLNYIFSYNFDFMAISCETISQINFYYSTGTYTGKSLATPLNPMYVGFDSKGRLVIISQNQISIHY